MPNTQHIFNLAQAAQLWAGHLIPNYTDHTPKLAKHTPIDNSVIGYIADGDAQTVQAAVQAAKNSFIQGEWSDLTPTNRRSILLRWATLIEQHLDEIAALDCIDAGKPISECRHTDMPATLETFYFYAEYIDKHFGKIAPTDKHTLGLIVYEPIGVVATILPWNFPAQMFAWKVLPALAAGNSVIVKPSELSSFSAYRMVQLAHQAGVPEGVLTLVCGLGEKVGKALGLHQDVDMVAFTGSTEVGRYCLEYAAHSNLKKIVLECGGKSPQLIFADADLDKAIPHILNAAFWNMGENCSCGSRLIVDIKIKDQLLTKLKQALTHWQLGDPRLADTQLGPLIEANHFNKVIHHLNLAQQQGGTIIAGGKIHHIGSGWYLEPTIIDGITPEMTLFQEEVFGPLLAVSSFQTEDEAIMLANHSRYGLAASCYTQNIHLAHRVAKRIRAGTVSINGFSEGSIATPFGGYRQSGFGGRDKGIEALEQYMQIKTMWFMD